MNRYADQEAGIYLRPMTEEDTDRIVDWRNREEVRKYFIYQERFTIEGHLKWLHNVVECGKAAQMIICESGSDRPLGSVYVRDIDREHRKGEYGIFIGEDSARGRGIGTAAAQLMIRYSFCELNLHRLFLRVYADNKRAIRSYEKAGFLKEAHLRDDVFVNGEYRDIVLMAVLNEKEG